MVKHVQILFAVMAGHLAGGCLLIPYGYTCESERVVAERKDDTGKVREQIVHRKMHLDIAVIGPNPEGGLSNSTYFLYSRFAHVADGKRSGIWAFGHFPMLNYDQWPYVASLPGTDRWIYVTSDILSADDIKIRMRIWSKKDGLVCDRTFGKVDRAVPWEPTDDPNWIRVNDRSGAVVVNVTTGKISRQPVR